MFAVGVDVSNGRSMVAVLGARRTVVMKPHEVQHTADGFADLAASLNALASAYLTRYCQPQLTMEVKAVDLSQIENVQDIKIGDSVRIIAKPYAVDQTLYLTQIKRDLQNVANNTITLSGHVRTGQTLTSQNAETVEAIKSIPSKTSILDAAKKNALNMLLDETQGGYIVYEYHETDGKPDYIEAINICNQPSLEASTSRWRWSYNGLGFLTRTTTSDDWSNTTIALTNTGEIVAERIGAGTITGCELYYGQSSGYHGRLYYDLFAGIVPELIMSANTNLLIETTNKGVTIYGQDGVGINAGTGQGVYIEGQRAVTCMSGKLTFYYQTSGSSKYLIVYIEGTAVGYIPITSY